MARRRDAGWWWRGALIAVALLYVAAFLVLPLAAVFQGALANGLADYARVLINPDVRAAVWLTLFIALIAVPLNLVFGLLASWCLGRFSFPGRSVIITLIDLPFSVSPVVAGLILVLVFGNIGVLGPFLEAHGIQVIFAVPGMVLATMFVTFPFVARELIPLAEAQGNEEEEAAASLGGSFLQIFRLVTLPRLRWALLYGVLLCNARALGEFGAVSVVSGKVPGLTNTLSLEVQTLYDAYRVQAAFAAASILAVLAIVTLLVKSFLEWRHRDELRATRRVRVMEAGP